MTEIIREARAREQGNISYAIRRRTRKNRPPLDARAPTHDVRLAPGSIWFFDAKTLSHQLIYGEGVMGITWSVEESGAPMQQDILSALQT